MKRAWSRKNVWDATPAAVKGGLGRVLGAVPLPWLLGRAFRAHYRFVEESQWWDAERLHDYQITQLKKILTLAYEKTAYYRRTFKAVGFEPGDFKSLADLHALPTINKTEIQQHLTDMLTVQPGTPSVDYMSTSGTGGNPLRFYIGADRSAPEFAHLAASWGRVGYRPGMTLAVLRGNVVEPDRSGLYHAHDPLLRHHIYSSFHLTQENMTRYVDHLHTVRPDFLHAYPSSAYTLTRFMRDRGLAFPASLRGILLESEPVYVHQRQFIAEHFPVRVYSSYGHTEKLVLAAECEHSTLYHVWPTYGYCEVLDEQGYPVADGQRGEIVGTGFINTVVPFIRYRTDDFAIPRGIGCAHCGRAHLLLDGMEAHRSQEFLVTRDYRAIIAWTALNMHDDTFDGISQFQFTQTVAGEVELRVVPGRGGEAYDLERIRAHLERKLHGQIQVQVAVCDAIEPDPSGKKPIVRQRVPRITELVKVYETIGPDGSLRP